jgi:hypothetical protein
MSNYANTVLLAALSELSEKSNFDMRAPEYGATNVFNKYKKDVILNYDELVSVKKQSDLQTAYVDYLRYNSGSVGSSRTHSLSGDIGDSTRDTLSFVTYQREFTLSDGITRNNVFKAAKMMQQQIISARLDIGSSIETAAVAALEAARNTVQGNRPSSGIGTWDGANNYVYEIANADSNNYYNYIRAAQAALDYTGNFQEVHTVNLEALKWYQLAQGTANSANMQYQYPDFDLNLSTSITNASDYEGTSYVVPVASVGLVDWIPEKNREGLKHGIWDFNAIPDPFGVFDRLALATYYTVADGSTYGGPQDAQWIFEMSVDVAFFIPTITTQKIVNKYALTTA